MTRRPPAVIFLNGPKQSGKSSLALALQAHLRRQSLDYMVVAHADPLARATNALFYSEDPYLDMKDGKIKAEPIPGFEHVKKFRDVVVEDGNDTYRDSRATPYVLRDWLVALGHMVRTILGKDALSRILLNVMKANSQYYVGYIVEGARTPEDIELIRDFMEPDNCILFRIHREGTNFEGDLGGYISAPGCAAFDLQNNATIDDLVNLAVEKINAQD
jgi:hypothetical protein